MPVSVCARHSLAIRFDLFVLITNKLVPRVGEIGKLLGAKWKDMDDEEKKVWYFPIRVNRTCC